MFTQQKKKKGKFLERPYQTPLKQTLQEGFEYPISIERTFKYMSDFTTVPIKVPYFYSLYNRVKTFFERTSCFKYTYKKKGGGPRHLDNLFVSTQKGFPF